MTKSKINLLLSHILQTFREGEQMADLRFVDIKNERILLLFSKLPLWNKFTKEQLITLLDGERLIKVVSYDLTHQKEEVIIKEGEFDSWVYWLLGGKIKIIKKKKTIREYSSCGVIFGEMAVISGQARSATVKAVRNKEFKTTTCLAVDFSIMDRLKTTCGQELFVIYESFIEVLAQRLEQTTEDNASLQEFLVQQGLAFVFE